jgi:DNA mismatch repair protein MSH6
MQSGASAFSGLESGDDEIPKAKRKAAPKKQTQGSLGKGDSRSFLTAAEERLEDKKADKKADEKPFDFLQDVKDKDGVRPGEPGYDPRTIYIPPKSWQSFSPFEKQVDKLLCLLYHNV